MTRTLLLGAVSTADKNQDPESQLRPLREAALRKGWEFEEISFKKSRWDATSAREVREETLARLRDGNFDVLAVWAWDRMSREGPLQALLFIRELEEHLGVRFFSLTESFLCTEAPKEQRELLLPLMASLAKWDSQRKSDRLVAKAGNKRESSGKLGQRARWGGGSLATPYEVQEILRLHREEAMSERAIARAVPGISRSQVRRIIKGEVKSA